MRVAAFLGSPRPKGNTDLLAGAVLEGAAQAGVETESFALRALTVHPCTGCEGCWKGDKPCIFQDDGSRLYEAIARSGILLFATPVYRYGPTAIMKAFIDRLLVDAAGPKGIVRDMPGVLDRARQIGRRLAAAKSGA